MRFEKASKATAVSTLRKLVRASGTLAVHTQRLPRSPFRGRAAPWPAALPYLLEILFQLLRVSWTMCVGVPVTQIMEVGDSSDRHDFQCFVDSSSFLLFQFHIQLSFTTAGHLNSSPTLDAKATTSRRLCHQSP